MSDVESEGPNKRARMDDDKSRAIIEATEALLPKSGTTWHVIFQNPDLFLSLIKIASPVLTDRIRFYPTIRRGFTGILIDEFAPSQAALMIGRLCCPVHIANVESGEVAVTVPTESLIATLKGCNAIQSVAMYQRPDSANVFFAILDPSSGHVLHDDIPTLCGTAHSTLKALKFQYELTVSVDKFKKDIGHVSAKGIAEVCLRLARVNPELFLLILSGTGERGNTFASLPITSAPTQKRLTGASEEAESGEAAGSMNLVHTVGQLTADSKGKIVNDTLSLQGLVPVSKEEIEKLEVCYKASFSIKYLEKMIKSLKDESQMTLFLGDKPTTLPLIIRFDLDIKHGIESYAAFVLAANIEES